MATRIWDYFSDIGIGYATDTTEAFFIKLSNRISFSMLTFILLPAFAINISYGRYHNMLSLFELTALFGVVFYFNAKGLNQIARYLAAFLPAILYYIPYLFQASDSFEYYTYLPVLQAMSLPAIVLLRFPEEKWLTYLLLLLFLAGFCFLDLFFSTPTDPSILEFIESKKYIFIKIVSILCWVLGVLVFVIMKYMNFKSRQTITQTNQELLAKEAELSANLKALRQVQEELAAKEAENQSYLQAIHEHFIVGHFATNGTVLSVNDKGRAILQQKPHLPITPTHQQFDSLAETNPAAYRRFWQKVSSGQSVSKNTTIQHEASAVVLAETYAPILNQNGDVKSILAISHDITEWHTNQGLIKKQTLEIEQRNKQLETFASAIIERLKDPDFIVGNFEAALKNILRHAAEVNHLSRASYWSFAPDSITCQCLYQRSTNTFSSGAVLTQASSPIYFNSITSEALLVADDALNHPLTQEFAETYLQPLSIFSMLDVAVYFEGKIRGVICFEMQDTPRKWLPEDRFFAQSIADIVALSIKSSERKIAEQRIQLQKQEIASQNEALQSQHEEISQQRKLIEARNRQLEASEKKLFSILDNMPAGVFVFKPNGELYYANRASKQILEINLKDPLPTLIEQIKPVIAGTDLPYPPEKMPIHLALKGKYSSVNDLEIRTSLGHYIPLELTGAPIFSQQHEVTFAVIIFKDISERKKQEFMLHLMNETFRNSRDCIWLLDGPQIIQTNQAGLLLFGATTVNDIMGKSPIDFSPPFQPDGQPSAEKANHLIGLAVQEGSHFFEWQHQTLDGQLFDAEVLLSHFKYAGKDYIQGVVRNISVRKNQQRQLTEKQQELNAQQEELISQNEQLSAALDKLRETQSQLVHSEKMATLGQLTAGIAHEINNPINFINSGISGLKKATKGILEVMAAYDSLTETGITAQLAAIEQLKKEKNYYLLVQGMQKVSDNIEMGIQRTTELIRELRIFSRNEYDNPIKADLYNGINSTLLLLRNQYKNRIRILKEYHPIPEVVCNPGQINQVFMNLLSNAMQAIENEGTIIIHTERVEPNMVMISITDDGPGIPPEIIQRVFDPFFTTKPAGTGTGLGLSISSEILRQHNGKLEVKSKPNTGTTFYIYLPIDKNY